MTLTFEGERARILKRTREAAAFIKGHKHDPTQMMELVRAAILPLFRYSGCFVTGLSRTSRKSVRHGSVRTEQRSTLAVALQLMSLHPLRRMVD